MAEKNIGRGVFITFEGPEGCGKSTHSLLLSDYLKGAGYHTLQTREPGGTDVGERIRQILLHANDINISDLTELYLFEANRSQITSEVIKPALADGAIVICDRFSDATFSYQGYGGKVPLKIVKALDKIATGALVPDLTILLDIDTLTGLRRAKAKGVDRMETKDIAYHKRVRAGYLSLAKNDPGRIKVIKVTGSIEDTQCAVRHEVEIVIRKHKRSG